MKLTLLAMILLAPTLSIAEKKPTESEMMATLSNPAWGSYETTHRRFKFLLGRFKEECSQETGKATIGDRIFLIHKKLKESGLDGEEGLLDLSNNLYRVTVDIGISSRIAKVPPPKCSESWVLYLLARQNGHPPDESRQLVTQVVKGFYRVK